MHYMIHIAHAFLFTLLFVGLNGQPGTVNGAPDSTYSVFSTPAANDGRSEPTNSAGQSSASLELVCVLPLKALLLSLSKILYSNA